MKTHPVNEESRVTIMPAQHGWFAVFVARDDKEDVWAEPIIAWKISDLGEVVYTSALGFPDPCESSEFEEDQIVGYRWLPSLYQGPATVVRKAPVWRLKYEDLPEADKKRIQELLAEYEKRRTAKSKD